MLSRLVIAFLTRSKCLLISWLISPSAVILEPPKITSLTVSIVSPSVCHEVMGPDAMILVFWMLNFKPAFHSPLSLSSVQFSHSVVSDSLRPHESQHARPPCPSPAPEVDSNSRPSSWWFHPANSCSVVPFSPAPNPSQHQGFSNESTRHMRWPKYWSFSFSISPSNEHPGLISFRMDWLDLLAVQGTLKSLLQHHS